MSEASASPPGGFRGRRFGEDERRAVLDRAAARYMLHGYTETFNDGHQAVLVKRQQVNVPLNLVLTIVSGGFWLVVLALRLLNWPIDRAVLTVDAAGELSGEFSS